MFENREIRDSPPMTNLPICPSFYPFRKKDFGGDHFSAGDGNTCNELQMVSLCLDSLSVCTQGWRCTFGSTYAVRTSETG